jgi:hypothetical protein
MAKRRRVDTRHYVRDKSAIALVKEGKRLGILSPQTKLHGGKYISRAAAKKAREYQVAIEKGYRARKTTKKHARSMENLGFETIAGNKVIVPPGKVWKDRVAGKMTAGTKRGRRGLYTEVNLGTSAHTLREFIENAKRDPENINRKKTDKEMFALTIQGNVSYIPFKSVKDMVSYVEEKYQHLMDDESMFDPDEDNVTGFGVIKFDQADTNQVVPPREYRQRKPRPEYQYKRRAPSFRDTDTYERYLRDSAERMREYRKALNDNDEKKAEYKAKARARAAKSYATRQAKKKAEG